MIGLSMRRAIVCRRGLERIGYEAVIGTAHVFEILRFAQDDEGLGMTDSARVKGLCKNTYYAVYKCLGLE